MGYQYPIHHYAQLYGFSEAVTYQYSRRKLPLDNPKKLLAELSKNHTGRPRGFLNRLQSVVASMKGGKVQSIEEPRPKSKAKIEADKEVRQKPPKARPKVDAIGSLQLELARLRDETDRAYQKYAEADNSIDASNYWQTWQDMLVLWGKMAKVAPEAEREAGNVARVQDIEKTWARTAQEMKSLLDGFPRRVATNPLLKAYNPVDIEQACIAELARVYTVLQNGEWLKKAK